ncbi:MAG: hypothetical protein ACFFG0_34170, partial [Candidatus Thorarchaeota archaeon]
MSKSRKKAPSTQKERIKQDARYWGMKYDIDCIIIPPKREAIADKYAEMYCRNGKCEYSYACCSECGSCVVTGCNDLPIPIICKAFFCSSILKKIPKGDLKILELSFLLK